MVDGTERTTRTPSGELPRREQFPTTHATLIGSLLDKGPIGRRDAGRHVMTLYARPLQAYLAGSSFRTVGDPEEVVQGFFADRLDREGFLEDWWQSGHRFRFWLIRAFRYYLLERRRGDKRWARGPELGQQAAREREEAQEDPERIFHREAALSIVRESCRQAERECRELGLGQHWQCFVRHHLDGLDYRSIGEELRVTPPRASVMARTAAGRFRETLRQTVAWKGATEPEVCEELESLLEVLG